MIDWAHLVRIKEYAGLLISNEGSVAPGVPEFGDYLGKFSGAFISCVMRIVFLAGKIIGICFGSRCDEVPPGSPIANVIQ
jgi:hypothetical protein